MNYLEIPPSAISDEALLGVIKSHILREGTDYGMKEFAFDEKIDRVRKQIQCRQAVIVYDQTEEVCHIIRFEEWVNIQKKTLIQPEPTYSKEN